LVFENGFGKLGSLGSPVPFFRKILIYPDRIVKNITVI